MIIEPMLFDDTQIEESKYLTVPQIEVVKGRALDAKSSQDNLALLSLIDSFVRANEKVDEAYEKLYLVAKNALEAVCNESMYPQHIMVTLPIMMMISFYDYLILTGVMSDRDIDKMQEEIMKMSMRGGPAKA